MSEQGVTPITKPVRVRNWDALAALIAAGIGVLALVVSGYTAYIQRQQVRAQVWPYLLVANYDPEFTIKVLNKGVGPAIVHSMQVWIDGKPQPNWKHVIDALGLPRPASLRTSTVGDNVISAGEAVPMIAFEEETAYKRFRDASRTRAGMEICYCSTLGDCWLYSDRAAGTHATQANVAKCPRIAAGEAFDN